MKSAYLATTAALVLASVFAIAGIVKTAPVEPAANPDFSSRRAIHIIVTFPPGGGTDLLARKLGDVLAQRMGQRVVVENRPGASGNIGARMVAESPPDGHTLLMVNSSFAINPAVYRELPFSPKHDFAPVINLAFVPSVIVVPAGSPHASLKAWMAGAASNKPASYASCGNGTPQHLAGEMLALQAGATLMHVPYKGCGPAIVDVASGQVDAGIVTASSAAPFIESGMLRALAITSRERSELLPATPSVAEQGLPDYELDQWHGLLAPASTPPRMISYLNRELSEIMHDPALQRELRGMGFSPTASTPEAFRDLVHHDIDRYGVLTQKIGLALD